MLLPPSSDAALANIALAAAGRVLVNLDATATAAALQDAVKIGDVRSIITSREFSEKLRQDGLAPPAGVRLIYIDDLTAQIPPGRKSWAGLARQLRLTGTRWWWARI